MKDQNLDHFAPPFEEMAWASSLDRWYAKPFFTNLDQSVYAVLIPSPEVFGALCSRASRAADDLRVIFAKEFLAPVLKPPREEGDTDEVWRKRQGEAARLNELVAFLHRYGWQDFLANPRARSFYLKWLAQYGDDSIAQMAGTHLVFWGVSQIALKHFEDQRIGLAPIEKSTRYVDYGKKIAGQYRYYTDPTLDEIGLEKQYRGAMDNLFETYADLLPKMQAWLKERFPDEQESVIRAKAFDVLRGLLPSATLSQVAFFGNGQAFEYMVSRSAQHSLGEVRWAARRAFQELSEVTPSFLRRVESEISQEYQVHLGQRKQRMIPTLQETFRTEGLVTKEPNVSVKLVEYDPEGEKKIIAGVLYDTPGNHRSWEETLAHVRKMSVDDQRRVFARYFEGRTQRWQKVGRALENTFVRFEITMNIGAYRDLHRHRMMTQQRQNFSCHHGYDIPPEIRDAGFEQNFRDALARVEDVFAILEGRDADLAQYATALAHRVRFQQWQNMRAFFWEAELRTIPEGHPDYRVIEQKKFLQLEKVFPLLCEHARVNMGHYDFARRGQEERTHKKETELQETLLEEPLSQKNSA